MEALDYNPVHPPSIYLWERTEGQVPLIDRALKCVVFIGLADATGLQFTPYGTGFIFTTFHEEIQFDYTVTCHHVINIIPGEKVWIRVNLKEGGSTLFDTDKSSWSFDPKQDIAVLSQHIGELAAVLRIIDKDIITKEVLKYQQQHYQPILPGADTIMVGLFTSHYGRMHNIPIVRVGNIAAMPDDLVFTDTGYVKAYLIEARSIGGLSGSPVFLASFRPGLLGMMRGRFNTKDKNDVVAGDSINDTINTGIGIVIPSEVIMDFINKPEFVEQREKTVEQLKKKTHFRPTAAIPVADNPQHKEDFNSLLPRQRKRSHQPMEHSGMGFSHIVAITELAHIFPKVLAGNMKMGPFHGTL